MNCLPLTTALGLAIIFASIFFGAAKLMQLLVHIVL